MDEAFGDLLRGLVELGIADELLLIFTSDHGEELGERDRMGWHSHALFDEQLRVPLLVSFPGRRFAGARVRWQVRGIDLLPTVLDVLGAPSPPAAEGASLLPLLRGEERSHRPAVSQRDVAQIPAPVSLRTGAWKYYARTQRRQVLLYDLADDPGETRDRAADDPQRLTRLKGELVELLRRRPDARIGRRVDLDPALEEQLRQLGYLE
jgi:choline-sulfatase